MGLQIISLDYIYALHIDSVGYVQSLQKYSKLESTLLLHQDSVFASP